MATLWRVLDGGGTPALVSWTRFDVFVGALMFVTWPPAGRSPTTMTAKLAHVLHRLGGRLGGHPGRLLDLRSFLPFAMTLDDRIRAGVIELVVRGDDLAASIRCGGSRTAAGGQDAYPRGIVRTPQTSR